MVINWHYADTSISMIKDVPFAPLLALYCALIVAEFAAVVRDSTTISATAQSIRSSDTAVVHSYSSIILDSPSSTSALTYKIQVKPESGNAVGVNRNIGNTLYGFSTILCMEVAA